MSRKFATSVRLILYQKTRQVYRRELRVTYLIPLRKQFMGQKQRDIFLFLARVCYAVYIYVEIAKVS